MKRVDCDNNFKDHYGRVMQSSRECPYDCLHYINYKKSVNMHVWLAVHLYQPTCQQFDLSTCLSIHLSVSQSACLSITRCLSVCLPIRLFALLSMVYLLAFVFFLFLSGCVTVCQLSSLPLCLCICLFLSLSLCLCPFFYLAV